MDAEDFQPQSVSAPSRLPSFSFPGIFCGLLVGHMRQIKRISNTFHLSGYWSDAERINRHDSFHSVFRLNLGSHLCPSTLCCEIFQTQFHSAVCPTTVFWSRVTARSFTLKQFVPPHKDAAATKHPVYSYWVRAAPPDAEPETFTRAGAAL